ncbi:MAG: phosphate ABC transporter permease subunit PstC [Clostridiales bacterium]|nr:phosphate ABC transporter permease subunit PstC [Clostridiales bacterium]
MRKQWKESVMRCVFCAAACACILAVLLICFFLFAKGLPFFGKVNLWGFLTGEKWKPTNGVFGILPMILGSVYVTGGALLLGAPLAILTAIYLVRFCPHRLYRILKPAVALLAGIPSVVYGLFGLTAIVPFVKGTFGGNGSSMLTACILLAMMILPTIIQVAESAIRSVPESYFEGSLALGATKEVSVFKTVVPAAKSGIMAAIILGVGRAVGETMAVMMVAGNQARMPAGILKGIRTMTVNIVMEMGYAADLHYEALIATGVVLFVFVLMINLLFSALNRRQEQ